MDGVTIADWLSAFVFTQLVEMPVWLYALRRHRAPWRSRIAVAFGASCLTHPIVWFVMPWAAMALYRTALRAGGPALDETGRTLVYGGLAEGFAVLAEALYLRGFRVRRPLRWSLLANAASVIVGTIVVRLL